MDMNNWAQGENEKIRSNYTKWLGFMENNVEFSHKASSIHTQAHCARVLLYALKLADALEIGPDATNALAQAAVFHDSRRLDDGYDVGHGARAAAYYRTFCEEHDLPVDERTVLIMAYHDRNDQDGRKAFAKHSLAQDEILYDIFKDADGLDRFRLPEQDFDPRYLRTQEAHALIPFAQALVKATAPILPMA